jgi:hypothetical protein
MDELARLIRQLIVGGIVICVVVVGFFFISAQVQLANHQAARAAENAAFCYRWAHHNKAHPTDQDRLDEIIGKNDGDCP